MRLEDVIQATGAEGEALREGTVVRNVRIDSRQVCPGDIFVCLPGERTDGHAFAQDALQRGAAAIMAQNPLPRVGPGAPVLWVGDCLKALGDLGAWWRDCFRGTVVAVTGSAGKTSVKEFLASILSQKADTARNYKNWNNRLGVPLSLLGCSGQESFWVMEAGVNQRGEMDELARILRPDIALIHNVGLVHPEGLGGLEGVAREKAKLVRGVRKKGLVVVSEDYPLLTAALPEREDLRTVQFSCLGGQVRYRGEYLGLADKRGAYRLDMDGVELKPDPGFRAKFQLENILAAAAAAWELGCGSGEIEAGLARAELPEHRNKMIRIGNWTLIDDCYNANPVSVRCALQSAGELSGASPFIAFLGDMYELGDAAETAHYEMGREAALQGVEHLLYSGDFIHHVERGFREAGGLDGPHPVETGEELLRFWRGLPFSGGTVLLKASRGCRLERFLQILQEELGK